VAGFTTVDEFLALTGKDAPTPAEETLVAACRAGIPCILGDGTRPKEPVPERQVRAPLLRLLITGGTPVCGLAEAGVDLRGGWIVGKLDLAFATARGLTALISCTLPDLPNLHGARLRFLNLHGSELGAGLFAPGLRVEQSVFLRDGFGATGTVDLNRAKIGGQLDCSKGQFDGKGGRAINAQDAVIGQSVFFSEEGFSTIGTVDLNGAKIGGQLDCSKGRFDGNGGRAINAQNAETGESVFFSEEGFLAIGTVDLTGARIGGNLDLAGGTFDGKGEAAIHAERLYVSNALLLRDLTVLNGHIDLAHAYT